MWCFHDGPRAGDEFGRGGSGGGIRSTRGGSGGGVRSL